MRARALFALILLAFLCYHAHAVRLPKLCRGLRCTNPFCDFECLRSDSGTTSHDVGLDEEIDDALVPMRN